MKIVAVLGSSRPESRSMKAANAVLKAAEQKGHEIVVYDLHQLDLKGCTGCKTCREKNVDCIQRDGLYAYWKDLHTCDVLLLTGANYHSQVCGQMITFMNRHYCLLDAERNKRLETGKKLIAIFSQGAPEVYPKYEPHYDWFLNNFVSKGMELISEIIIGGDSDLSENSAVMRKAVSLGEQL